MKTRLSALPPRVARADTRRVRRVRPPPKRADPELLTSAYRAWRAEVLHRAGYRCQWVEGGQRCMKSAPDHRLFADHIVERADGGTVLNPANGQCLCGQHHSLKTAMVRAKRARGAGDFS
jgi:5-methylcytosine-specific restriction enzyme A